MEEQNENIIAKYLKKDAEVLTENGIPRAGGSEQGGGSPKSKYWKFIGGFFGLVLITFTGILVVGQYMQKQEEKARHERIVAGMRAMQDIQDQLKNDKDGGVTPEETLKLFTAALKDGNIEKAKLYYSPYPPKRSVMFKNRLDQLNEEGKIAELINLLGKVKEEKSEREDSLAWFSYIEKDKSVITIELTKAEQFSNIWKIESLAY